MTDTVMPFETRLRRLTRKHRRMANGVRPHMGPDGLVTAYPRRQMPRFPLRAVVILFGVAFLFKAFMFASIGAASYTDRVAQLAQGSVVEQAGAWVMQPDPATTMIGGWITALVG